MEPTTIDIMNPTTKADWLRWCTVRDYSFEETKEELLSRSIGLTREEYDIEQYAFALGINDFFNEQNKIRTIVDTQKHDALEE